MLQQGHQLGSKQPGWRSPSAQWVAEAERMAALAERMPSLLKGDDHPRDVSERLVLARMCYDTKFYAAAARFLAEALEAVPKLGDDRRSQYRYNASCAAALASAGQGKDDPPPDEDDKSKLRARALGWLKAELAAWTKMLESGPPQARPARRPDPPELEGRRRPRQHPRRRGSRQTDRGRTEGLAIALGGGRFATQESRQAVRSWDRVAPSGPTIPARSKVRFEYGDREKGNPRSHPRSNGHAG